MGYDTLTDYIKGENIKMKEFLDMSPMKDQSKDSLGSNASGIMETDEAKMMMADRTNATLCLMTIEIQC